MSLRKKSIRQKAELGLQRARGKKGKGLGILGGNNSKTEAIVAIIAAEARRRTTIPWIRVPRTAAHGLITT